MPSPFKYDVIIVGGFGHIGLPLGIVLADKGLQVALLDIDQSKRPLIEAGEMPFLEYGAEPVLKRVIGKQLHVADGVQDVGQSELIIVTIGTPVDEYHNPRYMVIHKLIESMLPYLGEQQTLILRSTIYPGTTRSVAEFLKAQQNPVHVAFCPERIVQGYAIQELPKLPQVISGCTPQAIERSRWLFSEKLGVQSIEVSPEEAELVKLYSNAWRYIQFAIANQFYMMSTLLGADFNNIYYAMTDGYERASRFPRPGFSAGPCLLKDTFQLAAFNNNNFQLGQAAIMINEGLPGFLVQQLMQEHGDLRGRRVGILGMAFKADIDDIRDSLSYKLVKILRFHGAEVICSDEFVKDESFVSAEALFEQSEIVIIGVPHSRYRELRVPEGRQVIDLWSLWGGPS